VSSVLDPEISKTEIWETSNQPIKGSHKCRQLISFSIPSNNLSVILYTYDQSITNIVQSTRVLNQSVDSCHQKIRWLVHLLSTNQRSSTFAITGAALAKFNQKGDISLSKGLYWLLYEDYEKGLFVKTLKPSGYFTIHFCLLKKFLSALCDPDLPT
jgi:hypothetical protein